MQIVSRDFKAILHDTLQNSTVQSVMFANEGGPKSALQTGAPFGGPLTCEGDRALRRRADPRYDARRHVGCHGVARGLRGRPSARAGGPSSGVCAQATGGRRFASPPRSAAPVAAVGTTDPSVDGPMAPRFQHNSPTSASRVREASSAAAVPRTSDTNRVGRDARDAPVARWCGWNHGAVGRPRAPWF